MKKLNFKKYLGFVIVRSILLSVGLIGLIFSINLYLLNENINKEVQNKVEENVFIEEFCYKDSIANLLIELKVKYPHIVLAQSILESNNYSSTIFIRNNNPFGMKLAFNRPTTALGIKGGYAYYSSIRESIIDYAFMQAFYYKGAKSEEDYYFLLQESYAEDKGYIQKIRKIANTLK